MSSNAIAYLRRLRGRPRQMPRPLLPPPQPPKRCPISSRPEPHVVVVEGGAAIGRRLEGAGQRVDALPALEVIVGRDALDDHHTAPHAVISLGSDHDLAPLVAHAHTL